MGKKMLNTEFVTYYGSSPEMVERHLLQASFYFISSERINHKKSLYTVQNMMGDLGGIFTILYNLSGGIAYYVSVQFVWGNLIH